MAAINRALCHHVALGRFVTLFVSIYDLRTRTLRYCNAGHNPPVVVHADGRVVRLSAGGLVAGAFETARYEGGAIELEPGDRVCLFTDGLTEACAPSGAEFGDARLVEAVTAARGLDAAAIVDALFREVQATVSARARTTPPRSSWASASPRSDRQARTSSRAAAGQSGNGTSNPRFEQPARHDAAALEDQLGLGAQEERARSRASSASPAGRRACPRPRAAPRMNSALGSGFGRGEVDRAGESSCSISQWTARTKSRVVDPRDVLPAVAARAAEAAAHEAEQHVEHAAAVRAHRPSPSAARPCACAGVDAPSAARLPGRRDVDAEPPRVGRVRLGAADDAGRLVVAAASKRWA